MTSHDPLSESQSRSSIARLPPFLRYRDPVYAHAYTLVALPTTRTNATAQLAAYTTSICFNVNVQRTEGISRLTPSHPTKAQRIYYAPLPEVIFFFSERKNRNPTPLFIFEERRTKTKNVSYQTKIPLSLLVLSLLSYHPRFQHLAFFFYLVRFGFTFTSKAQTVVSLSASYPSIHLSIHLTACRHLRHHLPREPILPSSPNPIQPLRSTHSINRAFSFHHHGLHRRISYLPHPQHIHPPLSCALHINLAPILLSITKFNLVLRVQIPMNISTKAIDYMYVSKTRITKGRRYP